jgi:itaconate CoA-transferase
VDSPSGPIPALLPPVRLSGIEPVMDPIPALGQHSAAILAEVGFDPVTIARWQQEGVI